MLHQGKKSVPSEKPNMRFQMQMRRVREGTPGIRETIPSKHSLEYLLVWIEKPCHFRFWYIPGILHDQTVTWLVPKCRRKFWVGVCQVYTVCRHMKGICMFYTRYIPDIYYWSILISGVCLVYSIYMFTWNLSLQWCYILGICLVYTIDICGIY